MIRERKTSSPTVAIRTLLPDILTSLQQFTNATNQQKILYLGASYKPFVSLFTMTGASDADPTLRGIVDYASALTLEVRQSSTNSTPGAYDVRLNFKNGTQDADFRSLNMFGNAGVDSNLDDFVARLSVRPENPFFSIFRLRSHSRGSWSEDSIN